ncbi:MAG TPA: hypothetical protein VLA90_02260 [Actinomycetota bacterium]|nr:hypothetical protein [Actinomycetota bacterium]
MKEPIDLEERLALRGKFPGVSGRGPRRLAAGRVCAEEQCRTVLSVYNDGDRCWEHTAPSPYLLNVRRFRTTKLPA